MSAALAKPERFAPGWSRALAFSAALALHGLAVFAFLRPAAAPLALDSAIEVTVEPELATAAPAAPGPWPVAPTATETAPPAPQPAPVSSPTPTPEPQPAPPQAPPVAAASPDVPKAPAPTAEALPLAKETPSPTTAPIVAAPKPPAPRPSPRALAQKPPSPSPERAVRAKRTPETEPGRRPAVSGRDARVRGHPANAAAETPAISGAAYGALVSAEIARHKFYPPAARAAGVSGSVGVMVTIGASGRIVSHAIVRSSGHPELDGAVAAILSAVQAPPPPGGMFRASLTLHFAIE